jgi:CBS domain-containing protein
MSPRAAWRLETLGFREVYDYTAGKQDWAAAGLPTEGTLAERPRAGDVARRDVPTCRLDETVKAIRERVERSGFEACVVVNEERVVFGILREKQLAAADDEPAERAMRVGPSTFRPNVDIEEMAMFMAEHDLPNAPVTTSDGRLVGLLRREDAARVAHELHVREHHEGVQGGSSPASGASG